jgi:hypothetical protein
MREKTGTGLQISGWRYIAFQLYSFQWCAQTRSNKDTVTQSILGVNSISPPKIMIQKTQKRRETYTSSI